MARKCFKQYVVLVMFLKTLKHQVKKIGFKIVVAYVVLFFTSSLLLFGSVYFLFSKSLEARDREIVESKLNEYSALFRSYGPAKLNEEFAKNPRIDKGHFLLRIMDSTNKQLFFNLPNSWQKTSQQKIILDLILHWRLTVGLL